MAAGHFMMAFEGLVYVALATITIGNGLYLPSLPAQIKALYRPRPSAQRDQHLLHGINIGAFLAPSPCGTLGEL